MKCTDKRKGVKENTKLKTQSIEMVFQIIAWLYKGYDFYCTANCQEHWKSESVVFCNTINIATTYLRIWWDQSKWQNQPTHSDWFKQAANFQVSWQIQQMVATGVLKWAVCEHLGFHSWFFHPVTRCWSVSKTGKEKKICVCIRNWKSSSKMFNKFV